MMNKNNSNTEKFKLQNNQYQFPYHYLPHFDEKGIVCRHRVLSWGMEYLCYLEHVRDVIRSFKPNSVLEVGCGDGRLTGELSKEYKRVLGVDISEKAILLAQAMHYPELFKTIDAAEVSESFDVVVAMEVLEHIPDEMVSGFLKTLSDRANEGGRVIITVPTKVVPLHPKHYRHYDTALFEKQLNDSDTELEILKVEHVFKKSKTMRLYQRISNNRFFFIEWHYLRRLMWNKAWEKLRYAQPHNGQHLVVQLRKREK